jgi:hypothetical protein
VNNSTAIFPHRIVLTPSIPLETEPYLGFSLFNTSRRGRLSSGSTISAASFAVGRSVGSTDSAAHVT